MSHYSRVLDLLPSPWTIAEDSVVAAFLNLVALEMDAFGEDLDRVQRSHWIDTAFRLEDAAKLGALVDVLPLDWEELPLFRERLRALIPALRNGATGVADICSFVYEFLARAERVLGSTLVPGLGDCTSFDQAFGGLQKTRPRFRPLRMVENPRVARRSEALENSNGKVAHLFRWSDKNRGLDVESPVIEMTGLQGGSPVPVVANLTTGQLIGYRGRLSFGETVTIDHAGGGKARARVGTLDVSERLFSVSAFRLGEAEAPPLQTPAEMPKVARGTNDWVYISGGLYDVPGLDRMFFVFPDEELRLGRFGETTFDHSLFETGPAVQLRLRWVETEPASFEVHVPRFVVIQPKGKPARHEQVTDALTASVNRLRAAGVKAAVRVDAFEETQAQTDVFRTSWKVLPKETGSSGTGDQVDFGGVFGDSPTGESRFQ